ncbi:MAG: hypothetical protein ACP5MZ_03315 [Candidatus Micrarchaeia archaeon]
MAKRIIPARFRYPMFFAAVMIMFLAGVAEKYLGVGLGLTEAAVALGFIMFVASIVV